MPPATRPRNSVLTLTRVHPLRLIRGLEAESGSAGRGRRRRRPRSLRLLLSINLRSCVTEERRGGTRGSSPRRRGRGGATTRAHAHDSLAAPTPAHPHGTPPCHSTFRRGICLPVARTKRGADAGRSRHKGRRLGTAQPGASTAGWGRCPSQHEPRPRGAKNTRGESHLSHARASPGARGL